MISEADVRDALQKVVPAARVPTWSVDFVFTEGTLDSLDHAALALHLSERHGLEIPDEALPRLTSIRAILDYAQRASAGPRAVTSGIQGPPPSS